MAAGRDWVGTNIVENRNKEFKCDLAMGRLSDRSLIKVKQV
jgi:hypothetical protein